MGRGNAPLTLSSYVRKTITNKEFIHAMISPRSKGSAIRIWCSFVLTSTLLTSNPTRAEGCVSIGCLLNGGPFEYSTLTGFGLMFTTVSPFVSTSDATKDGLSKYYAQGVKDDAAAYLATEGDVDSSLLESAWREHLERGKDVLPSKIEFARHVLAAQG